MSIAQSVTTAMLSGQLILAYLININAINFLYLALNCQIYEWFDTWLIIDFQKNYDISNVHIEKRKFTPLEKKMRRLFLNGSIFFILASNIALVLTYILGLKSDKDELALDEEMKNVRYWIMICFNLSSWVFLVLSVNLFSSIALKHQKTNYL